MFSFTQLIVFMKILLCCHEKERLFLAQDLDSNGLQKKYLAKEIVINFFKDAIEVSNSNLKENVNTLLAKGDAKISDEFSWTYDQRSQDKFKTMY